MNIAELESEALVGDIELINKVNDLSSLQERLLTQVEQDRLFRVYKQLNLVFNLTHLASPK